MHVDLDNYLFLNLMEKYLAKQFGLLGDDDFEAAQIDQFMLTLDDLTSPMSALFGVTDEEKKREILEQISKDHLIPGLKRLEGFLQKNGNKFFVGSRISVADFAIYQLLFYTKKIFGDSTLDSFKDLELFMIRVNKDEKLKTYLLTRSEILSSQ
uniref:GST C-terminal domain-containing protein n=1 Tax=Parastrongyloides trichosuri TaxID=131310 RepID=A0A0N4ZAA7_PARTI